MANLFRTVVYRGGNKLGGGPSPSGRGRRKAPGEGHKSSQILRPSPFLKASPYRARASRPLLEGEGGSSALYAPRSRGTSFTALSRSFARRSVSLNISSARIVCACSRDFP